MRTFLLAVSSAALALLAAPALGQCPLEKILASDATDLAAFGTTISIDGNVALVGSRGSVSVAGSAYVLRRVAGVWTEEAKLDPSDDTTNAASGTAAVIEADVAVVGAPSHTVGQVGNAGAVYVFERQGGSWVETAKLEDPGVGPNHRFGVSLALSGDVLAIGGQLSGAGGEGRVFVYQRGAGDWSTASLVATLTAADAQAADFLGSSLAMQGDLIVAGAPLEDAGSTSAGAVYVFQRPGATWSDTLSIAKLVDPTPVANDQLGTSVAISGTRIVAGAPLSFPGHASSWDRVGPTWTSASADGRLSPSVISSSVGSSNYGASVVVDGDLAYVGGPGGTGAVRRFLWDGAAWGSELAIAPPNADRGYGSCVALRGTELWYGATDHREAGQRTGAIFRSSPRMELNYCVTSPNSVGGGALISACGSTSIASNDLLLVSTGVRPAVPGLFFYGSNPINSPFGDGRRCAGGTVKRLNPPVAVNASGAVFRPLDVNAPPANGGSGAITAGSIWNFQFWYRDPMGPGGSGFNLTDGVSVPFTP